MSMQAAPALRPADTVILGLVVAVAAIFAAAMLADYADNPGQLWRGLVHDRNEHFNNGLSLTFALQSLNVPRFLAILAQARIWPPVSDLALSLVMVFGAIDLRLAIVPSLLGWVCTIVLTFLIARRLFADRWSGNIAGVLAVTLALPSPAFRLITADVMFEGLGAALTAFCIYAYVVARAQPDRERWWGVLAIALTVLFFEKSNYWVLTALPLALAFLSEDVPGWWTFARTHAATALRGAGRALRDPFIIVAAILLIIDIGIYRRGPTSIDLFGRHVSLYPPENLVTVIWWILFIRGCLLWRQYRATFEAFIGLAGRRLFYWHVLPIALSFLIPKRLSAFFWYVGPNNGTDLPQPYNPFEAIATQWLGFSEGFHVASWVAMLVVALAAAAAIGIGRLAPGARAVLLLAAISAAAVVLHPQQEWRFQTTWLFAVWVLAGAGGAIVLSLLTGRLPAFARVAVAAAAIAGVAAGESTSGPWTEIAYAAAVHPQPGEPTDLDLAKAYLPHIRGVDAVGFLTSLPRTMLHEWTMRESCRCPARASWPTMPPFQSREQYTRDAAAWLGETDYERIVVIDADLDPQPDKGGTYDTLSGRVDLIEHDPRYELMATEQVPSLRAKVEVWRRRDL